MRPSVSWMLTMNLPIEKTLPFLKSMAFISHPRHISKYWCRWDVGHVIWIKTLKLWRICSVQSVECGVSMDTARKCIQHGEQICVLVKDKDTMRTTWWRGTGRQRCVCVLQYVSLRHCILWYIQYTSTNPGVCHSRKLSTDSTPH